MNQRFRKNLFPLWFYLGFFLLYALGLYLSLYQAHGLHPFQINQHFFSNVVANFSHRYLSEVLPYALLFFLVAYSRKKWLKALFLSLFLGIFFVNVNAIGYHFFTQTAVQGYILQSFEWGLFWEVLNFGAKIAFLILVLGMGVLTWTLWKIEFPRPKTLRWKTVFLLLILFFVTLRQVYLAPLDYTHHEDLYASDSKSKKMGELFELERSGVHSLVAEQGNQWRSRRPRAKTFTQEEETLIQNALLEEQKTTAFDPPFKKVVLIVVESLNQSFISHYNPQLKSVTPFLDQWLQTSPHVDEFYPSGRFTLHGLQAMLCGQTNMQEGLKNPSHLCLPQLLHENGFRTEFIRGFSKYYVNENVHFKKMGFKQITAREELDEQFPEFKTERPELYHTWGFSDDFLFQHALERLRQAEPEEKLFLTLLTVDTHTPGGRCYQKNPEFNEENPVLLSLRCFDEALKNFMTKLEEEQLLTPDTLIVLTSDQLYPNFSQVPGDAFQISFQLKPGKIPLLLKSGRALQLAAQQGSHVDIASSLLDAVNLDIPKSYLGKSLFSHPYPTPMGQDVHKAYMIFNGKFTPLSTLERREVKPQEGPSPLLNLKVYDKNPEELMERVNQIQEERKQVINANDFLYKWYFNHYHQYRLREGLRTKRL